MIIIFSFVVFDPRSFPLGIERTHLNFSSPLTVMRAQSPMFQKIIKAPERHRQLIGVRIKN